MFPNIWFIDTYSLLIFIGIIACFILFWLFRKKYNIDKTYTFDIFLLACCAIGVGILSAILFQILFDAIKGEIRGMAMTFYGGLIGGVVTFLLGYFLVIKKRYKESKITLDIIPIAPACITIAHAFGRIGCFMAGCCYGKETSSIFGVTFPGHSHAVYPTQLFEAIFLFLLTIVLFVIAIKKRSIFTLPLYLFTYGIFRFCLEYLRGDDRGGLILNLSPSQFISLLAILTSVILYILFNRIIQKEKSTN